MIQEDDDDEDGRTSGRHAGEIQTLESFEYLSKGGSTIRISVPRLTHDFTDFSWTSIGWFHSVTLFQIEQYVIRRLDEE